MLAENRELNDQELGRMKAIHLELQRHWLKEEVKTKQRSRDRDIKEGDRNTAYFHAVANQRRRKTPIHSLDGPDGPVNDIKDMLGVAVDFYKDLFKKEHNSGFTLSSDFFFAEELVTLVENENLESPFTEEEIKKAVFDSYPDGAPGPDGIPFFFYQHFWEVIKVDLIAMFNDFHKGELDIHRLNFAMLSLIPKEPDATSMKKFRPISLLNCSFKIFTKVLTNKLTRILQRLIASNQSAFLKGRYILESVVTAHEVVHSVHSGKKQGLVLKLDYEKAFDKVDLGFLLDLLKKRGFGDTWINWIQQITHNGSVGVKINNTESDFFLAGKGLRQGDPISPLLFNLVVDVLT